MEPSEQPGIMWTQHPHTTCHRDSSHVGIRDPGAELRDITARWTGFYGGAYRAVSLVKSFSDIILFFPYLLKLLGTPLRYVWNGFLQIGVSSVFVPSADPLHILVHQWLQTQCRAHDRMFTARSTPKNESSDELGNSPLPAARYTPRWVRRWIWNHGCPFLVTTPHSVHDLDLEHAGYSGGDIAIHCLGWSARPIMAFLDRCRENAECQMRSKTFIWSPSQSHDGWANAYHKPCRPLDTVHLDPKLKEWLKADISTYLNPNTEKLYRSRSIPYSRGYLFHGPPGTGKSSLSLALAGEFNLGLFEIMIPNVRDDGQLEYLFQALPKRSLVLLEDIDAVWAISSPDESSKNVSGIICNVGEDTGEAQHREKANARSGTGCTLSGLLNVLDGVSSQDGRIIIMTSNYPELLDSALTRPGRIDEVVRLGNISRASAREMFLRMFPVANVPNAESGEELERLATAFAAEVPEDTFTPAQLQGFFQLHLESPHDAAASIAAWVKELLS